MRNLIPECSFYQLADDWPVKVCHFCFFVERSRASDGGSIHMARTSGSIHMDRSTVGHAPGFKQVCSWLSTCFRPACDLLSTRSRKSATRFAARFAALQACISPAPRNWRRRPGRPRHTWLRTVEEDLRHFNLGLASGLRRAQNRTAWRTLTGTATSPTSSD